MAADSPQGEGWWQASDGKWYPPEAASVPSGAATAGAAAPSAAGGFAPPASSASLGASGKGFLSRLFDTSFKEFMTPSILRVLFWLGVVIATLYALGILVTFIAGGGAGILIGLILAPIVFFIVVIMTRVYIELAAVLFKIEENTR